MNKQQKVEILYKDGQVETLFCDQFDESHECFVLTTYSDGKSDGFTIEITKINVKKVKVS